MSIAEVYAEGRLIRDKWSDTDAGGRQLLCLYTALVGDPEARPDECPASIAPKWIAHLLPWWDDAGSEAAWPGMVVRVARIAGRLHEVPACVEWQCRAVAVREAMRHAGAAPAIEACKRAASLCERRGCGEEWPEMDAEMRSASQAAWAASRADRAEAWTAEAWAEAAAHAAWVPATAVAAAADRMTDAMLTAIERSITTDPSTASRRSDPKRRLRQRSKK